MYCSIRNGSSKPIRNINITNNTQPMIVRHLITSSRGIPVSMSVVPSYNTSEVSYENKLKILNVLLKQ